MNSVEQLNKLFRGLDMHKDNGLITNEDDNLTAYQKYFYNSVKKKMNLDAVFFLRANGEAPKIPLIYFTTIESYDEKTVAQMHKLAWNLGEAPLLFVVTPDQLLIYNNYEIPRRDEKVETEKLLIERISLLNDLEVERKLLQYHRVNLETGKYWKENNERFKISNRVDSVLIRNLKVMRDVFIKTVGSVSVVHCLLGRAILIKYLEDRKDSKGNSAFPEGFFGEFSPGATSFVDVLCNKEATYNMFAFFQEKFNGGMFPLTETEREKVGNEELLLLKDFLTGTVELDINQYNFWPIYSFNVIPIQLISTIYEMLFQLEHDDKCDGHKQMNRNGTYYTPYHLVELLLDEVLPWDGEYSEDRILDPSCGSGVFLVEAYRRIVARWMHTYQENSIHPEKLKELLSKHIFGVDCNEEAVRIASFSLCLVLCDYLEPLSIWNQLHFPCLTGKNLFVSDFFDSKAKFNKQKYSVVVGNPPWGSVLSSLAKQYVLEKKYAIGDNQISQAFTWKAAEICEESGNVCLVLPSKGFLFNRSNTNINYRREFFSQNNVLTILNFTGFRAQLFEHAKSPAVAVYFKPKSEEVEKTLLYCTPKPTYTIEDRRQFLIEPLDICRLPKDVLHNEYVWKIAMYGGPRDLELIDRLIHEYEDLERLGNSLGLVIAEGYKVGNKKNEYPQFLGVKNVAPQEMALFSVDETSLEENKMTFFERGAIENPQIFKAPHLLVKQSPRNGRLITALLEYDAIFGHSILGISGNEDVLKYISLLLSSKIFAYFSLMTSRRWIIERSELEAGEIRKFPIPIPTNEQLEEAVEIYKRFSSSDEAINVNIVDEYAYKVFKFTLYERYLVEDVMEYIWGYSNVSFRKKVIAPCSRSMLQNYTEVLTNVLTKTFGKERPFSFEIFHDDAPLLVTHISLKQEMASRAIKRIEDISLSLLLKKLDSLLTEKHSQGLYVRRNVIIYERDSIFIVKPNQKRYWNYSAACRDADNIYAQIMRTWRNNI